MGSPTFAQKNRLAGAIFVILIVSSAVFPSEWREALYKIEAIPQETFRNYSNASYSITVGSTADGALVKIRTFKKPIASTAPYPPRGFLYSDAFSREETALLGQAKPLLDDLLKNALTTGEAVRRIIGWIEENIAYEKPQDEIENARTAFSLRKGSCVGRAELAIAFFRFAGIPARSAHGVSLKDSQKTYSAQPFSSEMLHRWVEVFLPDIGWVFLDPGRGVLPADTNYILFGAPPLFAEIKNAKFTTVRSDRESEFSPKPQKPKILGFSLPTASEKQ